MDTCMVNSALMDLDEHLFLRYKAGVFINFSV